MTASSEYVLGALSKGEDFTLYRGRQEGNASPVLVVAVSAEQHETSKTSGLKRITPSARTKRTVPSNLVQIKMVAISSCSGRAE
jgi:hypothetical protein